MGQSADGCPPTWASAPVLRCWDDSSLRGPFSIHPVSPLGYERPCPPHHRQVRCLRNLQRGKCFFQAPNPPGVPSAISTSLCFLLRQFKGHVCRAGRPRDLPQAT